MLQLFKVCTNKQKPYPGALLLEIIRPLCHVKVISTVKKSKDIINRVTNHTKCPFDDEHKNIVKKVSLSEEYMNAQLSIEAMHNVIHQHYTHFKASQEDSRDFVGMKLQLICTTYYMLKVKDDKAEKIEILRT